MSNVDISKDAERLACEMDERVEAFDAMIAVQLESVRETRRTRGAETRQQHERIAATLRAQAARIAELEADNAILRTEKHADAEAIGALLSALTEIRDWRKSCHDHDKDMGHDPREFDVEDLKMVEFRASAAIKGVTNV